jgi:glyoxylase-like metal-dependent hydrolase (beta-lactamase superfamily II)
MSETEEYRMTRIHAIRTGQVQVRRAQMEARGEGVARIAHMLFDEEWSEWNPIYAWLIEHEEGLILVDTGETARVHERGYHPTWHPFYRRAVHFSVHPDEEIGPQLRALGVAARDIRQVVLTHLHTDHAGGLIHLTGGRVWISEEELKQASGLGGRLQGYLPHRWPKWWQPEPIRFAPQPLGTFERSMQLTRRGDVVVVPTPGHTPNHVSVAVLGEPSFFLAGDVSFTQQLLLDGKVGGVTRDDAVAFTTQKRILALAEERPLVYLPSHDPAAEARLKNRTVLKAGV